MMYLMYLIWQTAQRDVEVLKHVHHYKGSCILLGVRTRWGERG